MRSGAKTVRMERMKGEKQHGKVECVARNRGREGAAPMPSRGDGEDGTASRAQRWKGRHQVWTRSGETHTEMSVRDNPGLI